MDGFSLRLRSWPAMALALLCCLGTLLAPARASAASAFVDTVTITAGSRLTVYVSGFEPNKELVSWVESARGTVYPTRGGFTDGNGNASITINTRSFWESGWWVVVVNTWQGERQASANFEVLAAAPTDALAVSPPVVRAGGRVEFYGYGFPVGDIVSLWATRPDGNVVALEPIQVSASEDIYFFLDIPSGAIGGEWAMSAFGRGSGRYLVGTFTVVR